MRRICKQNMVFYMKRLFLLVWFCAILILPMQAITPCCDFGIKPGKILTIEKAILMFESEGCILVKYTPDRAALLQGTYFGCPTSIVLGSQDEVHLTDVTFAISPQPYWRDMYSVFNQVKNYLINTLGEPDVFVDTSYLRKTDIGKLIALDKDKIELHMNYRFEKSVVNMWLGCVPDPTVMVFYRMHYD